MHRRYPDDEFFHGGPSDRARYDNEWRQSRGYGPAVDWQHYGQDRRSQRAFNEPYGIWNEHRDWPQRGSDYGRGTEDRGRDEYDRGYDSYRSGQAAQGGGSWRQQDDYPYRGQRGHYGRGTYPDWPDAGYGSGRYASADDSRFGQVGGRDSQWQDQQQGFGPYDPDYDQWRREQVRGLDEDYRSWRDERYKKFSDEFNTWRSNRPARSDSTSDSSSSSSAQHGSGKTPSKG